MQSIRDTKNLSKHEAKTDDNFFDLKTWKTFAEDMNKPHNPETETLE